MSPSPPPSPASARGIPGPPQIANYYPPPRTPYPPPISAPGLSQQPHAPSQAQQLNPRQMSPYPLDHASPPPTPSGHHSSYPPAGPDQGAASTSHGNLLKSRSVMACALCRKQKMKCEGPDNAPCRRCRTAGVECVFESPMTSAPRPRPQSTSTDAWVESRLQQFEDRLLDLENSSASGSLARISPPSAASIADYERRLAQVEAQLYALHFAAGPPPHVRPPHLPPHPPYGPPPPLPHSYSSAPRYPLPQHLQQYPSPSSVPPSPYSPSGYPPPGHSRPQHDYHGSASPSGSGRADGPLSPGVKREARLGSEVGGGIADQDGRPEKRWRSAVDDDLIARGELSEEEAHLCFDSYFFSFRESQNDRPIQLPFEATRARSPLLLAVVIFIGARSLARSKTANLVLDEALRLCHADFLSSTEPTTLNLKAIILLSLYTGMPDLHTHSIAVAWRLATPNALLQYDTLSDEEKSSPRGRMLLTTGRTFLVSFLWTSYYTYERGLHGGFDIPDEVLIRQIDILEASEGSLQPTDRTIRVSLLHCLIFKQAFRVLGPSMQIVPPSYEEASECVQHYIAELVNWSKKYLDVMEHVTVWGDSAEFKAQVPFHHGRLNLVRYIFALITDDSARSLPRMREFAKMAHDSALVILRWGVESRIWLPHSCSAVFLHYVNIPTSLDLLYKASRLFPSDANFLLIRQLLHRLLSQCESQLANNTGYPRELARTLATKELVVEFDRFAFEQVGDGPDLVPMDADARHFGEDISASLGALGGELSLFGVILLDALEFDQ